MAERESQTDSKAAASTPSTAYHQAHSTAQTSSGYLTRWYVGGFIPQSSKDPKDPWVNRKPNQIPMHPSPRH